MFMQLETENYFTLIGENLELEIYREMNKFFNSSTQFVLMSITKNCTFLAQQQRESSSTIN